MGKSRCTKDGLIGISIEQTIVRLDRVGFYILGNKNHPTFDTPVWLWTIAEQNWRYLRRWVIFRQTEPTTEQKEIQPDWEDWYHDGYGAYFRQLGELAKEEKRKVKEKLAIKFNEITKS